MGVYIRGMEMPYGCANCDFVSDPKYTIRGAATYSCSVPVKSVMRTDVTDETFNMYEGGGGKYRPDWCPLVEVKEPHGDLIDRDNLLNVSVLNPNHAPYITIRDINNITVVIEAEGEEE